MAIFQNPEIIAYLGLGSNVGDKIQAMTNALALIEHNTTTILKQSFYYKTAPWGLTDQDWFINMCIQIQTRLTAFQLLEQCQNIERMMGRERKQKWGPRIIDIDILDYNQEIIDDKDIPLILPHPFAHERNFVVIPLAEIAPKLILHSKTLEEWRQGLSDKEQEDVAIYQSA